MKNQDKAFIYDECLRESDNLQRINSKLKSEYAINTPPHIQEQINKNTQRINELVKKLNGLFE